MRRFSSALILALITVTAITGCGKSKKQLEADAASAAAAASAAEQKRLATEHQRNAALKTSELQNKAAQALKDPSSVQFRGVSINEAQTAICGELNAKNSFGGYVGFRQFFANDAGLFTKPPGCGTVPIVQLSERSIDDATACLEYVKASEGGNGCN